MFKRSHLLIALAAACLLVSAILAASQNFRPDVVFKGSTLAGWHTLGQADWRAEDGEIIGTPRQGGGWLVLDKGYQDIAFYSSFRCTGACKTGVLLRAQKTPEGMSGVFVSLNEGDVATYDLVLDAQGNELRRAKLGSGPGAMIRMASGRFSGGEDLVPGFSKPAPTRAELDAAAAAKAAGSGGGGGGGRGGRGGPTLTANEWHTAQIIVDADVMSLSINGRGGGGATTSDRMMGFGPIALYAGGSGEVRFKDVSYKDLNSKTEPKETVSRNFEMQRLSDFYYAWCAAAADINRDGVLDVIAGPFYYLGPRSLHRTERVHGRSHLQP
jgi:hypothetical protein